MTTSGQQNLFAAGATDDPMTETKEKATAKKSRSKSVVNAETMAELSAVTVRLDIPFVFCPHFSGLEPKTTITITFGRLSPLLARLKA